MFCFDWDQIPLLLVSHLSPNELESLVQEAEEASGASYKAALGCAAAPAGKLAPGQPCAKRTKCAFAGDVDMPQAANASYEKWTQWRDHVAATFGAFLSHDMAAKKAGEYHVEVMHRGLGHAGVDVATAWAAPSAKTHEALLMIALYESHARWKLDVVAGEWRHVNPLAQAPPLRAGGRVGMTHRPLIGSALRSLSSRPVCRSSEARRPRHCRWVSCSAWQTRSCITPGSASLSRCS